MTHVQSARPTSVTIAVVIGWISVLLDLAGGVSLFLLAGNADFIGTLGVDESTVRATGIVTIVIGLILAGVVSALGRGSGVARALVTIVMLVRMALGIYGLVAFGTHQAGESVGTVVVALAAIFLLWNHNANEYFARR